MVRDLHEKRRHPLRRVVEARHLNFLNVKLAQNNSFLNLIDHLHDLEQLHQRLVHMFWVLTKTKLALVIRLLNKNLKVDAVAGLLNRTEELGVVLRLHVVLHHFHLRMNKYNAKAHVQVL